jgi:rare lipoprotein A
MRRAVAGAGFRISMRQLARIAGLASGCLALAHCGQYNHGSRYSERVVEEGQPVPKGGGVYRIGQAYQIRGRTYVPRNNPNYREDGIASWYGRDFHGRRTANGEIYDMHAISAAHPTLPIPSYARVTNLRNGKSLVVRVNDRGPFVGNRVIDLSVKSAKILGTYSGGLARVRVEYLGPAPLEGSDDRMLLATLRHGGPAPAPSLVRVAAAKPVLSEATDDEPEPRVTQIADRIVGTEVTAAGRVSAAPRYDVAGAPGAGGIFTPRASFAPPRDRFGDALMSGRGLY